MRKLFITSSLITLSILYIPIPQSSGSHPSSINQVIIPIDFASTVPQLKTPTQKLKVGKGTAKAKKTAPKPSNEPHTANVSALLLRIRHCESTDNYTAQNQVSTASGAYQFVDGTWNHYKGYAKAKYAPPKIQDNYAKIIYAARGSQPWISSKGCWG